MQNNLHRETLKTLILSVLPASLKLAKLGVADLISPGLMIGFESGVRIKLSDWGALRIGLTAQASRLMYVNMANDNYYAVEYAVGLNVKLDL